MVVYKPLFAYIFFIFSNSIFVIINLFLVEIKNLIKQAFG